MKGVLTKHGIEFPSSAKKSRLVSIFNDEVTPNAEKWLESYRQQKKEAEVQHEEKREGKANKSTKNNAQDKESPEKSEDQRESQPNKKHQQSKDQLESHSKKKHQQLKHQLESPLESPKIKKDVTPTLGPKKKGKKRVLEDADKNDKPKKAKAEDSSASTTLDYTPTKTDSEFEKVKKIVDVEKKDDEHKTSEATSAGDGVPEEINTTTVLESTQPQKDNEKNGHTETPSKPLVVEKSTPAAEKSFDRSVSFLSPGHRSSPRVRHTPHRNSRTEQESFDDGLKRIKKERELPINLDLAAELGITVEGRLGDPNVSSQSIASNLSRHSASVSSTPRRLRSSNPTSPRRTPLKSTHLTPNITPRPRLLQIGNELSITKNDELEDEDEGVEVLEKKETSGRRKHDRKDSSKRSSKKRDSKKSSKTKIPLFKRITIKPQHLLYLLAFTSFVVTVLSSFFGYWYYGQIKMVGYCGEELHEPTFKSYESGTLRVIGDYMDNNLKPLCVPCPNHARCFSNLELACFEDFIEFKPWNNFLKPYNKKCVSDTKKAEKIEIIIDVALDLLRSKNADKQCGLSTGVEEAGVSLVELHDLLFSMKAPYITTEEFEELWERSVVELEKEPDVTVRQVRGITKVPKINAF